MDEAEDVEAKRDLLAKEIEAVSVQPGKARGRFVDHNRVDIEWRVPPGVQVEIVGTIEEVAATRR